MRRPIALAVLALHGLLLWLLALGFRQRIEIEPPRPQFVSLWIDMPPPPQQPPPPPAQTPPTRSSAPTRRPVEAPVVVAPITLPVAPVPEAPVAPATQAAPPVDWAIASARAARRAGEASTATKSDTFSPAPKLPPKACKPKRSMEWKGYEDRTFGMTGGVPYVKINEHCVLVALIPMCVLGKLPEANGHLLDDMKDPNRTHSSVPDTKVCD